MSREAAAGMLPASDEAWAEEACAALKVAHALAHGEHGERSPAALETLYKFAPLLCARNRGMSDQARIRQIAKEVIAGRVRNFRHLPGTRREYAHNFLRAYLEAHRAAGLLDGASVDRIMARLIGQGLCDSAPSGSI